MLRNEQRPPSPISFRGLRTSQFMSTLPGTHCCIRPSPLGHSWGSCFQKPPGPTARQSQDKDGGLRTPSPECVLHPTPSILRLRGVQVEAWQGCWGCPSELESCLLRFLAV